MAYLVLAMNSGIKFRLPSYEWPRCMQFAWVDGLPCSIIFVYKTVSFFGRNLKHRDHHFSFILTSDHLVKYRKMGNRLKADTTSIAESSRGLRLV